MYNCIYNEVSGEANGTHSSTLAGKMPWTEEPGGLQSMGLQRVGHDWLSTHAQGHVTHLKKFMSIYWFAPGLSLPLGRCMHAAMNIRSYVQVLHPPAFRSSGFSPRSEAVRFHAVLCVTFRWTTELSSGAAVQFYVPTSNVAVSNWSVSLPTVATFWFSVFLTIIILMQMKLRLPVILIYISLVSNEDMCLCTFKKKWTSCVFNFFKIKISYISQIEIYLSVHVSIHTTQ